MSRPKNHKNPVLRHGTQILIGISHHFSSMIFPGPSPTGWATSRDSPQLAAGSAFKGRPARSRISDASAKGISLCLLISIALAFGCGLLNLSPYISVALLALLDIVLILILVRGDIRIR